LTEAYSQPSCALCTELEQRSNRKNGGVLATQYRRRQGRFDIKGKERWFSASGISKPNKTVLQAQRNCPFYKPKQIPRGLIDKLFREDNDRIES